MGNGQILDVEVAFAIVGVLFDIEEIRTILRLDCRYARGDIGIPGDVLLRWHRAEAARRIVCPLRRVRR